MARHGKLNSACIQGMPSRRGRIRIPWFHAEGVLRDRFLGGMVALAVTLGAWITVADYFVDFEGDGESKTSYAEGFVTLSAIEWRLHEALVNPAASDKRHGLRSMRMRRSGDTPGLAEMQFDKLGGIGELSFYYARYGTETDQPSLYVEYSPDAGGEWLPAGEPITDFPDTLTRWATNVFITGNVRVRFRTGLDGTSQRRFNIDDIRLTDYGPTTGVPVVTTSEVFDLTASSVRVGGEVLHDGGFAMVSHGVVFNTAGLPTTNDWVVLATNGTAAPFEVMLTGLLAGQVYYTRAFAQNSAGAGYGPQRSFRALAFPYPPVLQGVTERHADGVTVEWEAMDGAAGYEVDVATDERFAPGGRVPVVRETMGRPLTDCSIAAHAAAYGFDRSGAGYVYGDGGAEHAADIRRTSPSTNYVDHLGNVSSGGGNVFFSTADGRDEVGFSVGGISSRHLTDLWLGFAYRKDAATNHANFEVAWSADSGGPWEPVAVTGLPAQDDPTGWYCVVPLSVPPGAEDQDGLGLRWIKRGGTSMRIDDVLLQGDSGAPSLAPGYDGYRVMEPRFRLTVPGDGDFVIRVRAVGTDDFYSAYSAPLPVTIRRGLLILLR